MASSKRRRRALVTIGGALLLAASLVLGIVFSARLTPTTVAPEPPGGAPAFPSREEALRNWPCFRGPDGNGVAACARAPIEWDGASGKGILWKTETPRPGFSSPVVWGKRVFVTGGDEDVREVFCFDADKGTLLWRAEVKDVPDAPADEISEVSEDTGFAAPTAATDGRRVYAIFATGEMAAFDFEGKTVWAKHLGAPENNYGHSSSLMTYNNVALVQFDHDDGSRLIGIDGPTGNILWEIEREVETSWATPIVIETGEGPMAILCADPMVAGYDPESGDELWSIECIDGEIGASAAYANGIVFAGNDNSQLSAIDLETKKALWETYDDLPDCASLLATDRFVFLAASWGALTCRATREDKIYWQQEFDEGFYASPVLVGDSVYVMDREGLTRIVRASDTYELLATCPLGERSDCTPAIVSGRIFIRGVKHLYCIGEADG